MPQDLASLLHTDDAIELIREWVADAPHPVELLPCSGEDGERALLALQVTTHSSLGALALHTGGLLVDHGWLRILGAGCARFPRALDTWNHLDREDLRLRGAMLVADDAVGGFFAWFGQPNTVHYFAPDTFIWEDLGLGYTDWLVTMLSPNLEGFYAELRWPGWVDEVSSLDTSHVLQAHPPLVFEHDGPRSRAAVPVESAWVLGLQLARALEELPPGGKLRFEVVD